MFGAIDAVSQKCSGNEACATIEGERIDHEVMMKGDLPKVTWEKIIAHIDHAVKTAGVDHVGLGSDFDGATMPLGMVDASTLPKFSAALLNRVHSAGLSGSGFVLVSVTPKNENAMQTAFSLPETIALLSRTPSTLNTFLRGLPSRWVAANEGADSWSAFDIVGHLVIGERTDWMPRAKRILEHGEAIPFDPFDRFAQGKECRGKSLEELLDEFAALRAQNLVALETLHLCPADLAKKAHINGSEPSRLLSS